MSSNSNNDWVEVRLSQFGERYVEENGGGPLRVHEGPFNFAFQPGEPQRVTRSFDWERVLKNQHIGGNSLFEIVPAEDERAAEVAEEIHDKLGVRTAVKDGEPEVIEQEVTN